MKKNISVLLCFATILFACNNASKNEAPRVANDTGKKAMVTADPTSCFSRIAGKDSVFLHYTTENGVVSGNLTFNYFEKDKNTGSISGRFIGDTLLVDYTFRSEGMLSTREVIFLSSVNALTEGFGDVEEVNGKMIFKNRKQITFSPANSLQRGNCDEIRRNMQPH